MGAALHSQLAHVRLVHHAANVLGVTTSGYAGATISGSDVIGLISALVAIVTLGLGVAAGNAKRRADQSAAIQAAELRGSRTRDEEVARLTQWMEFYRQNYASLLQDRAGAPQQILPPQSGGMPLRPPSPPTQGTPR